MWLLAGSRDSKGDITDIQALAGKMKVLKRVIARAGFLAGFFMLIWPMNSAAFAAACVRAA
jgi:hypothetical protein